MVRQQRRRRLNRHGRQLQQFHRWWARTRSRWPCGRRGVGTTAAAAAAAAGHATEEALLA